MDRGQTFEQSGKTLNREVRAKRLVKSAIRKVARDFGVSEAAVVAPTRGSPQAAVARQAAMYLAHVLWGLCPERVGLFFNRDRTTVAYACRRIEDMRDNADFDARIGSLENTLLADSRAASASTMAEARP